MLGLGLSSIVRQNISHRFLYTGEEKEISYLGITLTPKVLDLVKENYSPFLQSFRSKLDNLGKCESSWSGKIAAFKMQVLSRHLYLLRSLPIPAPNSLFSYVQSNLNRYLWIGKKAWCAFSRLIKLRGAGGMGHTDLRDYHTASILAQIKEWFAQNPNTLWAELEQHQVRGGNLYYLTYILHSIPYNTSVYRSLVLSL